MRRSRRLVVSSIATVGNYEYGFYWYFYLDGTHPARGEAHRDHVDPGAGARRALALRPDDRARAGRARSTSTCSAPASTSTSTVRSTRSTRSTSSRSPAGPDNPWGNAFVAAGHPARDRAAGPAAASTRPAAARWKIVNPASRNRLGEPVAYKLVPGATPDAAGRTPTPASAAGPASPPTTSGSRPYAPDERRAAGDYPNQHAGGDGLPRWTAADRSLVDTDIVVWHTFGVTHVPRPEDWPVMPVEYCGFLLVPVGFFDRNPALDVPAAPHCT